MLAVATTGLAKIATKVRISQTIKRYSSTFTPTAAAHGSKGKQYSNVFLFTGQGSAFPGMGKDLYENSKEAKAIFQEADDSLRMPLSRIMFEGDAAELKSTAIQQPAVITISMAAVAVIRSMLGNQDFIAASHSCIGHSVGELSAICAAGVVPFSQMVNSAHRRGILMAGCLQRRRGSGMAAFHPLPLDKVRLLLRAVKLSPTEILNIGCINTENQIVLSGDKAPLERAIKIAESGELGLRIKAKALETEGAFHSAVMESAYTPTLKLYESLRYQTPTAPIWSNLDASPMTRTADLKAKPARAVSATVDFLACLKRVEESIAAQRPSPTPNFFEIGPKSTLLSFSKSAVPHGNHTFLGSFESIRSYLHQPDNSISSSL